MNWYYLKDGSPKGPVTTEELIKEFQHGQLCDVDNIFKEGDIKWRAASEFIELKNILAKQETDQSLAQANTVTKKKNLHAPDAKWVVLIPKIGGIGFSQRGPFNDEQIRALLKANQITLESFIWQKGFQEWKKIQTLDEFNSFSVQVVKPLPPLPDQQSALPKDFTEVTSKMKLPDEITKEFKLEAEETAKKAVLKSDPKPELKIGPTPEVKPDLKTEKESEMISDIATVIYRPPEKNTSTAINHSAVAKKQPDTLSETEKPFDPDATVVRPMPAVNKSIRTPAKSTDPGVQLVRRSSLVEYYFSLDPVRRSLFIASLVLITIAFIMITAYVASYFDRKNAVVVAIDDLNMAEQFKEQPANETHSQPNEIAPQEVSEQRSPPTQLSKNEEDKNSTATVKAAEDKKPVVERSGPTYIQISVDNNGLDTASLSFKTDGSFHYPIELRFFADGGRTLSTKSIYKYVKLKNHPDKGLTLRSWGLPFGYIDVEAKIGDVEKTERVQYGTRSSKFRSDLELTRKKLVHSHIEERNGFIKTVSRMDGELRSLIRYIEKNPDGKSLSSFYRSWFKSYSRAVTAKVTGFSRRSRSNYIHPKLWESLKEEHGKVTDAARALLRNQSKDSATNIQALKSASGQMSKLKSQMLSEQLWD